MIHVPSAKAQIAGIARAVLRDYLDAGRRNQVADELLECIEQVADQLDADTARAAAAPPARSRRSWSTPARPA